MQADLAVQLGRHERDDLEFKRDTSNRDGIHKVICAFANDLPGRGGGQLLIGVEDDGRPFGLPIDDTLLRQITEYRNDGRILPAPTLVIERASFAGQPCVHVTVPRSPSPPVKFDGRVYVRVGPSTRQATREEERLLAERRRAADVPFDQQPVAGSTLAELDVERFRSTYLPAAVSADVIEANQRDITEQLASLRLMDPSASTPTVWGVIVKAAR